jgi:hypothetical protein
VQRVAQGATLQQDYEPGGAVAPDTVGAVRLAIGLVQGLAAWQLLELVPERYGGPGSDPAGFWSYHHPITFAILTLWTAFVPLIALAELPRMRRRHLIAYVLAVLAALAVLVAHDLWREPMEGNGWSVPTLRVWPSPGLVFGAGIGLFIANQLMEHRERRHRLFTEYAAHFDDSWMRGFQLVISLGFTLLVWGVLELGQALFGLIHVEWFGHMLEHNWFRCPVLATGFAAAVHLTDVRPALLRGMRNVGLTLLAWLLPLVVALGCAFVIALAFTGLAPLWATRFAATILLTAVAVMLVYLNAAYNDGDPANRPLLPLRWAGRVAGPLMLLLSGLAAYAIMLRVGQHGWTPQRVRSAAVALVALIYGIGYSRASLSTGPWLKPLERVNVVASLVILALLVAVFTPLADPARLAVNSQVGRLKAGSVAPDAFDYQFLRFEAGRYGTDALAALTHDGNATIAARAKVAQAAISKSMPGAIGTDPVLTEPALSHVTVFPAGAKLPTDFVAANVDGSDFSGPNCLRNGSACDVVVWTSAAQGSPLLLVINGPARSSREPASALAVVDPLYQPSIPVLGHDEAGKWVLIGHLDNPQCGSVLDSLRQGKAVPVVPRYSDVQVGAVRLAFTPLRTGPMPCPAPKPAVARPATTDSRAPAHMGPAFGNPAP